MAAAVIGLRATDTRGEQPSGGAATGGGAASGATEAEATPEPAAVGA